MRQFLLLSMTLLIASASFAQNPQWKKLAANHEFAQEKLARDSYPSEYKFYSLDLDAMKAALQNTPQRNFSGQLSNVIVQFPDAEGRVQHYRIYEASVMHPELAARHPEIRSYSGKSIDNPAFTIRFSITPFGLHAMVFTPEHGTVYIDPYTKDLQNYIIYEKTALTTNKSFKCGFKDLTDFSDIDYDNQIHLRANNSLFKTYRLAMACTIEYAAFHINAAGLGSGTIDQKKAAVLAAMAVTMTRVDGVYEREFSLTMVLIPNNEDIIFVTSDTFDNSNTDNVLLDQSQSVIDATIGIANYDIGHTVSTGGGGVAQLQSPCSSSKARGLTGLDSPVGDGYDIDYVSHEMGHQFGCSHTFNGDQGACNGNRTASSAFEPGSGTTIMSYSGICDSQNIQFNSNDYFHARSLIQAAAFINGSGNCAVAVPNGNTAPTVSAGQNYTIPYGTAFMLHGTASDVDGDAITYCWEQYNNEISIQPPVATSISGPNFRSFPASPSPDRYFPNFSAILVNNLTPVWEVVPNVARPMTFSLVARDNRTPNGGQTERSTMQLTFANTGPFKVTSQNTLVGWISGTQETVTWDVAGTTENGINTSQVKIRMSTDGGLTFPYILAESTDNDGSESITVPSAPASMNCRIMVEAIGNVFFALNIKEFTLGYEIVTNCVTYEYNTPFTLADGSSTFNQKTINVPDAGTISDVNISINATHPNIQNLNIAVIRPGGPLTNLFNQQCPGSADLNVTFDADGSPFTCGSPTAGTYIPPTGVDLHSFEGFTQQGDWRFGFRDIVAGDVGTINSISLEICTRTFNLASTGFEFDGFALYPNPNDGKFTIRFNASSSEQINITVADISGRKVLERSYSHKSPFSSEINLENIQSGVYLVTISDGDKKMVRKIIKQ